MTDRINALIVALEHDLREDDDELEDMIEAIKMIRGVAGVKPRVREIMVDQIAYIRLRTKFGTAIIDAVTKVLDDPP